MNNIKIYTNYSFIDHLPRKVYDSIREVCSYKIEGVEYMPSISDKTWLHRRYLFTKGGRFPTGLLHKVEEVLKENKIKYRKIDNRGSNKINKKKIIENLKKFGLAWRPYQIEGVIAGLENRNGMFEWATGSGKTVLFSSLIFSLGLKTLIVTNTKELLYQIQREVSNMIGEEVGIIGDSVIDPKRVTVGIVNSLIKKNKKLEKYLESIKYVLYDEVHHLGSDTWKSIAFGCKNALVRHGFSGTCYRADSKDLLLEAFTGNIISKVTPSYLIKEGFLARPVIRIPICDRYYDKGVDWHTLEKKAIVENEYRNRMACEFIKERYDKNKTILVLVKRIKHGMLIKDMLLNEFGVDNADLRFMSGSKDTYSRKEALKDFRDRQFNILIGTDIYKEGVDVPSVDCGANLCGGTSQVATTQRLGRVIRKPIKKGDIDVDTSKSVLVDYLDFYDMGHRILKKHSKSRMGVYEKEEEFRIKKDF